ncbi:stage 0 sporulation protein [Candidatus Velamenicoccus archaeovorus]|uniref:Stage 0 sporulation protein n=1 Tax=Velamenicoccus archaeovorus TaxID=1930593 RepID=A0A410P564_VELA1|nr:stage 0 sporulation protein [Candidatus Velamenicoccus archaeovorus]
MEVIAQVRLREMGSVSCYHAEGVQIKNGDLVIAEVERGIDYGQVVTDPVLTEKVDESVKKVLRIATDADLKQIQDNRKKAQEASVTCSKKIEEHKLDMKLVGAEYAFDRSKILFYFTAEGRVDFRELVKELAKIFKARIELRQIGVRDEAKILGGFGPCGKELCCCRFLKDFEPVTIRMAKDQNLPLNPPKISGLCGRLMCCLSFEHKHYKEMCKGLPREGERVETPEGKGKVISVNILKRKASILLEDGKLVEMTYKIK